MKTYKIEFGHEVRGFMLRLYPTADEIAKLHHLQADARTAWNWICKQTEDTIDANRAFAVKTGLVEAQPVKPDYNGLTPEESKAAKKAFKKLMADWGKRAYLATKNLPGCKYRNLTGKASLIEHFGLKYDYQMLQKVIEWKYERLEEELESEIDRPIVLGSVALQALAKNHRTFIEGQGRKKFRRSFENMPLQTKTGICIEFGDFGSRGSTHKRPEGYKPECFYNCLVKFNGLRIRGRLPGKIPEGRILEGVSITEKADGWWASIKQELPIRVAPTPVRNTVVGIDVGLDNIAAISEIRVISKPNRKTFAAQGEVLPGSVPAIIPNIRDRKFSERIGKLQKEAAELRKAKDYENADKKQNQANRLNLAGERHIKHQIHNLILKPLERVETIKIEGLNARIGQMGGSPKVSVMRLIASMLKERFGEKLSVADEEPNVETNPVLQKNRVREVECFHTSQDCSHCTKRSKESWSYDNGRIGKCTRCLYENDRDANAARNVAAKSAISLAA
jgi:transposase